MVRVRPRKNYRKKNKRQEHRILYLEAITFLLESSLDRKTSNPAISRDYYLSARKMGMRGRQHMPKPYRLFFCRSCNNPLQINAMQVRLNSSKKHISYNCLKCGNIHRFGYLRENRK